MCHHDGEMADGYDCDIKMSWRRGHSSRTNSNGLGPCQRRLSWLYGTVPFIHFTRALSEEMKVAEERNTNDAMVEDRFRFLLRAFNV